MANFIAQNSGTMFEYISAYKIFLLIFIKGKENPMGQQRGLKAIFELVWRCMYVCVFVWIIVNVFRTNSNEKWSHMKRSVPWLDAVVVMIISGIEFKRKILLQSIRLFFVQTYAQSSVKAIDNITRQWESVLLVLEDGVVIIIGTVFRQMQWQCHKIIIMCFIKIFYEWNSAYIPTCTRRMKMWR